MTTLDETMTPLWMIGCGNMGGAMLTRWIAAGLDPAAVTVVRPSGQPVAPGVRVVTAIPVGEAPPRTLILAVKPQKLADVAADVAAVVGPDSLVVSILAGARVAALRDYFPGAGAIVRALPNTPVAIGKGVVGLHAGTEADAGARDAAAALMAPLGLVEWIADEEQFDLVTALSGSGPAFLFRFVGALATAGAELGLPADQAARLAIATVEGAALLAAASDETPGKLADRVASPGGSTRKGLDVLDAEGGLLPLLRETLAAAARRNAEMAAEAVRA
ncbi:pyrroline-5-carboxylate reductase [Sphingomonas flavalba]|uniref:pyrroline-5-carboxylate reductase n=1 Tax=Sphingomonas flavalba TaxID=2559804 RepID=UPI0039DF2ECA